MVKEILRDKFFLFLCLLFLIISLGYPLTLTWDSAHYMLLADVIKNGTWVDWDPIRGIVFPLFLNLSTLVFGRNQNALLLPMIFAQMVLFLFLVYFIFRDLKITKASNRKIIIALVFFLVMLDPVIMGYYHTLLTEFFAATLAIVSCYFAYKLYYHSVSLPALSKSLILSFFYFLLAVPFAWHLKQPYIGTVLFPFLLSCFLIVIRDFQKKVLLNVFLANILILVSLGISIVTWAVFLRSAGMPSKPDREITGFFSNAYETKADTALISPFGLAKYFVKNYLSLSNFFLYDRKTNSVIAQVSVVRAFQNQIIATRMYDLYGQTNTFYMTSELQSHVKYFSSIYFPPLWFNTIQLAREKISNFLFTLSYLIVPFVFFLSTLFLLKKKTLENVFVFLCSGSAVLNAISHAVLIFLPIDRYVFWGYPLNLIVFIIIFVRLVRRTTVLSNIFILLRENEFNKFLNTVSRLIR